MKKNLLIIVTAVVITSLQEANSQGCVAIRSTGGTVCALQHPGESDKQSKWQVNTNFRYFKSFRHFKGKEEQKERLKQNTEVINRSGSLDLTLVRIINSRWSFTINFPILFNTRSSLYEHGLVNGAYIKKERRSMHSYGLGDIRIAAYSWLWNPEKMHKGNIQVGLGIKFATGEYDYKDYWYNVGPNESKELRTVDQSIQLGDGGTGLTLELNSYYNFNHTLGVYGNFFYLSNPREQNGVRTYRETLSPALYNETICSVPDQFMAKGGVAYSFAGLKSLTALVGARIDGIPVHDVIGGSGDFRRPGYVVEIDPAISYSFKKSNLYLNVPVAVVRNRTQSVTDKERSITSGTYQIGDAAFSDYIINVGYSIRF